MDGLRAASTRTTIVHSPEAVRLANTMREASDSNWRSRFLIFVRGLPGSGKSTLARFLIQHVRDGKIFSVNDHIPSTNNLNVPIYRSAQEYEAQAACKQQAWAAMQDGIMAVVIDNDNLLALDMEPYIDEGVKRGYSVHLIEPNTPWRYSPRKLCRHTSKKISPEQLQTMLDTFDRRLREEELVSAARRRLNPIALTQTGTPSVSTSVDSPREPDAVADDSEQPREDEQFLTAKEDSTSDSGSSGNLETNVGGPADESPNNPPQPSCSLPPESVDQLAVVFPRIARARLREYLHLANGDVQWASSLILEGLEVAIEINSSRPEESSLSSSDADDGDTTHESVSASHLGVDPTKSVCTQAEEVVVRPVTGEVPLVATVCGPNEETATNEPQAQEETKGLRISREFIKEAHELYSYSSGLTAVELSAEAVPDFFFQEWSPEPELVRAIYQSFMRYLGVLNGQTTVGPRRTPGRISHPSSFRLPSRRGRGRHSPYVDRGDHFSAISQQDEALYRSVQDFRSSLDAPVVRRIIDRLLKKVPGIQRSTVEEAFVRNEVRSVEPRKRCAFQLIYCLTFRPGTLKFSTSIPRGSSSTELRFVNSSCCVMRECKAHLEPHLRAGCTPCQRFSTNPLRDYSRDYSVLDRHEYL
ncbi:hypothetical protein CRM22_011260 [Opisthorchis felineus]|uniref:CUE domain-containing protein n=1 Tax=Opisthorchis felineus TaxID=147828 RepID=A0A4S2JTJ3_OPIFE|nr:hypothetical protein CRM22_011260 [Opisthorchis felineus]TGZ39812.1 hypothetical protein CRM22_011260 [Opisthorchis felineus]